MTFAKWIDTLIEEKGYDTEHLFEVEGKSGANLIPLGCVVEAMKLAPDTERKRIKSMLVKIDFVNGDCLDFFEHCSKAIAR